MDERTSLLPSQQRLDSTNDDDDRHHPQCFMGKKTKKLKQVVAAMTVACAVVVGFRWNSRVVDPSSSSITATTGDRSMASSNSRSSSSSSSSSSTDIVNELEGLSLEEQIYVWDGWKKFLAYTSNVLGREHHHDQSDEDPTAVVDSDTSDYDDDNNNNNNNNNDNDNDDQEAWWRKFLDAVKDDWGTSTNVTHSWFQKEWNATSTKERQWFHHVQQTAQKDWNATSTTGQNWFHHLARVAKRDWDATSAWMSHEKDVVRDDWHRLHDKERHWWHDFANASERDWERAQSQSEQWWHQAGHAAEQDWNKTKATEQQVWDGAEHWVENVTEEVSDLVHHHHHDESNEEEEPTGAPLPVSQKTIPSLMYLNHSQAFAILFQRHLFSRHAHDFDWTQDYFLLNQGMDAQINQAYCGVASTTAVLNSLRGWIDLPMDPIYNPYPYATQANMFGTECTEQHVNHHNDTFDGILSAPFGVSLKRTKALLDCHLNNNNNHGQMWNITAHHVDPYTLTLDNMRRDILDVLRNPMGRVVINFDRAALGQIGHGHFSPIGAYSHHLDAVLVMDVAKYKYPPAWVPMELLYDAVSTVDTCGQWDGPAAQGALPEHLLHPTTVPHMAEALKRLECKETFRGYITIVPEDLDNASVESDATDIPDSATEPIVAEELDHGSTNAETDTDTDADTYTDADTDTGAENTRDGDGAQTETDMDEVDDRSATNSESDTVETTDDTADASEVETDTEVLDDDESERGKAWHAGGGRHKKRKRKHDDDDAAARDGR